MKVLEKKIVYVLFLLVFHSLSSNSIYAFENLISPNSKIPSPFSKRLGKREGKTSVFQVSQERTPEQTTQSLEQTTQCGAQARAFLQPFPKIAIEMKELERHIPTLIPEHRRNPKNLCNHRRSGDWRVLMAWPVRENLDSSILERIKKMPPEDKGGKNPIKKLQASASLSHVNDPLGKEDLGALNLAQKVAAEEKLMDMPEMLRTWFLHTCKPSSRQELHSFSQEYSQFNQWWESLPPQLVRSQNVKFLYPLLKEGNNTTQILNLLENLLVESLFLRTQSLYEELLPTYMDLKTSYLTLMSLKKEALREDRILRQILQNRELFKEIECTIGQAIKDAVAPLLENALEPMADGVKQSVRDAFQQGMADVLKAVENSSLNKGGEGEPHFTRGAADSNELLKRNLHKAIIDVMREAINNALRQATGHIQQGEQWYGNLFWGSASKKTTGEGIIVDIAPIMERLSEFLPEQPTSWYGFSSNRSSLPSSIIRIHIPADIQQKWKIPPYRPIKKSTEESRKEYLKNQFPEGDIIALRRGLLKQIRRLRQYHTIPSHSQLPNLKEFLSQKNSVHLLFDIPRAYTYFPGIRGAELLPKILRFFEEYETLLTSYQRSLKNASKEDLCIYLDPKRLSSVFCSSKKEMLEKAFPLLETPELTNDWISDWVILPVSISPEAPPSINGRVQIPSSEDDLPPLMVLKMEDKGEKEIA